MLRLRFLRPIGYLERHLWTNSRNLTAPAASEAAHAAAKSTEYGTNMLLTQALYLYWFTVRKKKASPAISCSRE